MDRKLAVVGSQESIVGELSSYSLADVLLWLHRIGRSAVVQIGSGVLRGAVALRDGNIIRCEYGESRGELALGALLTVNAGSFTVAPLAQAPEPNVFGATEALILRWALAKDLRSPRLAVA
jgi:hypothetical protein